MNESRQSESTSNSATRVNDPSKFSRHRTRVRVSGPVYHPSENSSHRIRVRVGGPGSLSSRDIHGRHRTIISSYRNSDVIYFGSPERPRPPSVSSAQPISVIHPSNFASGCLSSIGLARVWPPRLAHRSLDPPSEGAPSTDLVNENILRFRLSLGASHAWSCCDVSGCRRGKFKLLFNPIERGILNPTLKLAANFRVRRSAHTLPFGALCIVRTAGRRRTACRCRCCAAVVRTMATSLL